MYNYIQWMLLSCVVMSKSISKIYILYKRLCCGFYVGGKRLVYSSSHPLTFDEWTPL